MLMSVLIEDGGQDVGLEDTRTNSQNEQTDQERSESLSLLEDAWDGPNDLDDVRDPANQNTDDNGWIPSNSRVTYPCAENGECVCEKSEEKNKGICKLKSFAQSSSGVLGAFCRRTSTVTAYIPAC